MTAMEENCAITKADCTLPDCNSFLCLKAIQAARAEGMREAARIAARHATGGPDWARHATAIESSILSAIGGQK